MSLQTVNSFQSPVKKRALGDRTRQNGQSSGQMSKISEEKEISIRLESNGMIVSDSKCSRKS